VTGVSYVVDGRPLTMSCSSPPLSRSRSKKVIAIFLRVTSCFVELYWKAKLRSTVVPACTPIMPNLLLWQPKNGVSVETRK